MHKSGNKFIMSLSLLCPHWVLEKVFTVKTIEPLDRNQETSWIAQCLPILACRKLVYICILIDIGRHPWSIDLILIALFTALPHSWFSLGAAHGKSSSSSTTLVSTWEYMYTEAECWYTQKAWKSIYGWMSMHWAPETPNACDTMCYSTLF